MNWIATNIRFPEDQYMKLKQKAAAERKSLAAVIRQAASQMVGFSDSQEDKKSKAAEFIKEVRKVAKANAKYTKDFDIVKALREIRYQDK